jgi:uncharacterized membrane protein
MTSLPWILLVVAVLLAMSPKWTRPDLYFAVTVETDFAFTPQARRILRRYWLEIALHTVVAWCLASLVGMREPWPLPPAIGWLLVGSSWATARAHRMTAQYAAAPSPLREAKLAGRPEKMPGGWGLAIGPLILLGAAAVYAQVFWDDLPQRIAVHWGLHGADRWIERTPLNVFRFLALLASVCGTLTLLAYGTLRWSRTISVSGERAHSEARFRRRSIWLLLGIQYLVVIPAVALAFRPETPAAWVWPVILTAVIAGALITLIRMGQGGSRVAAATGQRQPVGDHTPDAAWKWGLVYYNPDDPALIVEKRIGIGYTVNFANRWSWALMGVILLPVVVLSVLR